jgi:hypothetical protein
VLVIGLKSQSIGTEMTSPYLDLPRVCLADALKAGIKALCATNGGASHSSPPVTPDCRDNTENRLALRQADQARGDRYAIGGDDLDFVKSQLAGLPSRAWLARMGLIGFGSVWALIAAVALILAR